MKPEIKIFTRKEDVADALAEEFIVYVKKLFQVKQEIFLAFSGGSTPELFFRRLSSLLSLNSDKIKLNRIHFFWCDERCVPPDSNESNFGMMKKSFSNFRNIPSENIHRIKGEDDPQTEVKRYSEEIKKIVPLKNGYPVFDWIFLGIGDDGHTASIFPDQLDLLYSKNFAEVAKNPQSGQSRITLTGKVLINATRISYLVTGDNKKGKVKEIINDEPAAKKYPAYFVKPISGHADWYLDKRAAILLNNVSLD